MPTDDQLSDKLVRLVARLETQSETSGQLSDELNEMRALLSASSAERIEQLCRSVDLVALLSRFDAVTDQTLIRQIVTLLSVIFDSLSASYILSSLLEQLLNGLSSTSEETIELWLKTLSRCLDDNNAVNNLVNSKTSVTPILVSVVSLLSHSSTTIAKHCAHILLNVTNSGLHLAFYDDRVQQRLLDVKKKSDIVRMRVNELLVSIANVSQLSLNRIDNCGHLAQLINEFCSQSNCDPLVALNSMQIISDLAATPHGAHYLENSSLLEAIATQLQQIDSIPFSNLLIPGYIKIFATLANKKPIVLDKYPIVLHKLETLLDDSDQTSRLCALDAIGIMCLKNECKTIINRRQGFPLKFMTVFETSITIGSTELKSRALNALSQVLQSESDPNGEATTITESWFRVLPHNQLISTLLSICKQPILELRLPALECVRVLAIYIWGQKELASFPGFLEYIIDRSTEFEKLGKEAKYVVIRELVVSPFISLSFTREAIQRLRAYYQEGPYHVDTEAAVTFEGAD